MTRTCWRRRCIEELVGLGFDRSYPTLVREIRELGLRPVCECCQAGGVKLTVGLEHEPGEELQLDWLELSETPWGVKAYVLVGALSHSGRLRGCFSEGESFPHLAEALDGVLRRLGGTARCVADRPDGNVRVPGKRPAAAGGGGDGQALRRAGRGLPARTARSARGWSRRRSSM